MNTAISQRITRIKSIYIFIYKRGIVTTQEIIQEFGVTQKTINRDLDVLVFNDLIYKLAKGKWTTTDKKVKIPC